MVYALAWAVGAVLLQEERRAVLWWATYCVLQAVGLDWIVRYPSPQGTIAPAALALLLASYACATLGVDAFVNGRVKRRALWFGTAVAGVVWHGLGAYFGWPGAWVGIGHNLCVVALLALPLVTLGPALKREFGLLGWLAMAPVGLMCLFASMRVGVLILHPEAVMNLAVPGTLEGLMQTTLLATGAFNVAFLGLVLGRLVRQLRNQVDTDPLTGLISRAGLERRLAQAWAASVRHGSPLALAFIDIDDFKAINDSLGHAQGDRAIQSVGQVLLQQAREADTVGRWGGDEFMIVMPQTTAEAATVAVGRMQQQLQNYHLTGPLAARKLAVSVGLVARDSEDRDVQALVRRADAAMYRHKQTQKSQSGASDRLRSP